MSNIFAMADTWNNGATVFTAIKMVATDTAFAAGTLLIDLQTLSGGSQFSISNVGAGKFASLALGGATIGANVLSTIGALNFQYAAGATNNWTLSSGGTLSGNTGAGTKVFIALSNLINMASGYTLGWANGVDLATAPVDVAFSRVSAGLLGVGTGAQGSVAGSLSMTGLKAIGNIDFTVLPSSDPGVPGRLYRTSGAVMVSL